MCYFHLTFTCTLHEHIHIRHTLCLYNPMLLLETHNWHGGHWWCEEGREWSWHGGGRETSRDFTLLCLEPYAIFGKDRERLKAKGEGGGRGGDGEIASPTQGTRIWVNSGREWRTEEPGMLQSTGSQRVGHDLKTEQQQYAITVYWEIN